MPLAQPFPFVPLLHLQGIGKTLNPSYNFSEVATPYAQELLQIQDGQQQGFIIEQLQQQATEVRSDCHLGWA
jgi:predicted unusual protein kinase regulating ubiquinone biosynthesis (AarF/ABC1/UbiB family)